MTAGRDFARSGAVVFVGTTLGQVAQLGLLTVLAHQTSVSDLGVLLAVVGVLTIVIDVVDFGTSWRLVRNYAAGLETEQDGASYFTSRTATGVLGACVVALAGLAIGGGVGAALLWLSPWVVLRVASQGRRALLQMKSKFTAMAQSQLSDRGLSAIVGVALLLTGSSGHVALGIGYAAGSLCALILGQVLDRNQPLYQAGAIRGAFRSYAGGRSFGVTLVITDLASLDLILLTWVAGSHQAGLFALPSRIALPVTTLATSIGQVALGSLASHNHAAAWRLLKAGARHAVMLSATGLIIGMIVAEPLLRIFGGHEYVDGAWALRLILFGCLISVFNQLMLAYLQSQGFERFAAHVLVPAIMLSLAVVAGAGWRYGATGAAAGLVASNALILPAFAWKIRSLLRLPEGPSGAKSPGHARDSLSQ